MEPHALVAASQRFARVGAALSEYDKGVACDELVPFKGHCEFIVLYGMRFCTWGVYSHGFSEPFEQFMVNHLAPKPPPRERQPRRPNRDGVDEWEAALRRDNPWLTEADTGVALGKSAVRRCSLGNSDTEGASQSDSTSGEDEYEGGDSVDDIPVGSVAAELAALRGEFHIEAEPHHAFRSFVLGGEGTFRRSGVVADGQKGKYRTMIAHMWCERYYWPKERSFFFSIYTHVGATMLVGEFVRSSNHYFNLAFAADALDDYVCIAADTIEDDLEFLEWLLAFDVEDARCIAGSAVRSIFPVNPSP